MDSRELPWAIDELQRMVGVQRDQIERLTREVGRLRTAFRVNMLRDGYSDAEINKVLDDEQKAPDLSQFVEFGGKE